MQKFTLISAIGERLGVAQKTVSDDLSKNCNLAKITQDLGEQWNEQVSLDTNFCNLARICNDLGDQWNEQGVAVGTVNSMFNNCNLAKIEQDLGEQWNEQGVP